MSTHDPLCVRMRSIMIEEPRPPACPWCNKIAMIRSDESIVNKIVNKDALDKAYADGYKQGREDGLKERRWAE